MANQVEKALEAAKRYNWRLIYERWDELPRDLKEKVGAVVASIMGTIPPELEKQVPEYMRRLWEEKIAKPPPVRVERVERRPPEAERVVLRPVEAPPAFPPWWEREAWRRAREAVEEYHRKADDALRPGMTPEEVAAWYAEFYDTRLNPEEERDLKLLAVIYAERCRKRGWPIPEWAERALGQA